MKTNDARQETKQDRYLCRSFLRLSPFYTNCIYVSPRATHCLRHEQDGTQICAARSPFRHEHALGYVPRLQRRRITFSRSSSERMSSSKLLCPTTDIPCIHDYPAVTQLLASGCLVCVRSPKSPTNPTRSHKKSAFSPPLSLILLGISFLQVRILRHLHLRCHYRLFWPALWPVKFLQFKQRLCMFVQMQSSSSTSRSSLYSYNGVYMSMVVVIHNL